MHFSSNIGGRMLGRVAPVVGAITLAVAALANGAPSAQAAVPRVAAPPGVGTAPAGTGMGTPAALNNAKCDTTAGAYGRWNNDRRGDGPVCVVPWPAGKNNGGATTQGVTKNSITVVAIVPNAQQIAGQTSAGAMPPVNRVTGATGRMQDALHDLLTAAEHSYEEYGRKVDLQIVESTGADETSQRADAVTVLSKKPFAVMDATPAGLDAFESTIAAAKVPVNGYAGTVPKSLKQAPYRWGQSDSQASAINSAEFAGKQLVGKAAQWAGDPTLAKKPRVFGAVYANGVVDMNSFSSQLAKYHGKVVQALPYTSNGSTLGDTTSAQEAAPVIVSKLKGANVTSVFLFTDVAMTGAVLKQATQQEFKPEWIITAYQYQDLSILSRPYDQDQWAHAFGISNLYPYVVDAGGQNSSNDPFAWFWGPNNGTYSVQGGSWIGWLMTGIHAAGPKLTPTTFQQGLFAIPATGGAASGYPIGFQVGYGKTVGLPYDEYMALGTDFSPIWYDADTVSHAQILGNEAKGTTWYLDGAKRYHAGTWNTKPLKFFDKSVSVDQFDTSPIPVRDLVPCVNCPSSGGNQTPAASAG
jgi:hypothetical protein